jgi:hypothetical protein
MENLRIRCKSCNREIEGHPTKTVACGCSNMATIRGDKISAVDLTKVIMLNSMQKKEKSSIFTNDDLAYQEARRQRKVRRLDFEIR